MPEEAKKYDIEVRSITDILDELMRSDFVGARDEILRTVDLISRTSRG